MNVSKLPCLLLMSVNWWLGATAVHATDPASPIGFWKGGDGTFEMFETAGKLSGRTYSCFIELQGPDRIKLRGFLGLALMGRNYFWVRAN